MQLSRAITIFATCAACLMACGKSDRAHIEVPLGFTEVASGEVLTYGGSNDQYVLIVGDQTYDDAVSNLVETYEQLGWETYRPEPGHYPFEAEDPETGRCVWHWSLEDADSVNAGAWGEQLRRDKPDAMKAADEARAAIIAFPRTCR